MRHVNITPESPICHSCELKLSQCSYAIQDFWLWICKNYNDMHIAQGFRNETDQHTDFLEGKSKLDWPRSAHNNMQEGAPFSEAIDIFQLVPDGTASFLISKYQDIHDAATLAGQQIIWGGSWVTFKDYDHFQSSGWSVPNA